MGTSPSAYQKRTFDFWPAFRGELLERKMCQPRKLPIRTTGFTSRLAARICLSNVANTADGRIGARLHQQQDCERSPPALEAERSAIDSETGEKLEWNPEAIDKTVELQRTADLNDRSKWPEYVSWPVDKVDKFKKAFGPRVKKLNLDQASATTSA